MDIPKKYTDGLGLVRDAYTMGFSRGESFPKHNVPELGKRYVEHGIADAENIREIHASECYEAEQNSRQYSPFEFTAKEFNDYDEGGWRLDYNGEQIGIYESEAEAWAVANSSVLQDGTRMDGWAAELVPSSEELWQAFDDGISDGIAHAIDKFTDEDYGIEPDPWEDTPEGYVDYVLPSYWASYLINGDASGIDDGERAAADAFCEHKGLGHCVDCSTESWFAHRSDASSMGGDVCNYRFELLTKATK